jgi:hypothetical protein
MAGEKMWGGKPYFGLGYDLRARRPLVYYFTIFRASIRLRPIKKFAAPRCKDGALASGGDHWT